MCRSSDILTSKCIRNTFPKTFEPVTTSCARFLLTFNLRKPQLYFFLLVSLQKRQPQLCPCFKSSRQNISTFLDLFHSLNITGALLSWIFVTCKWLLAFWPLNTFFVPYFSLPSMHQRSVFLLLNPLNQKMQVASFFLGP